MTRRSRELASARSSAGRPIARLSQDKADAELNSRVKSFLDHGGVFEAADVISAAFILGIRTVEVEDAAHYVLADANQLESARTLAHRILKRIDDGTPLEVSDDNFVQDLESIDSLRGDVAALKRRLRREPRNAIEWVDLARCYTELGQHGAAANAIRVAEGLAPDNRFIVRSAVRFHVHEEDFDKAHSILLRAAGLRDDPWLLSAEIAVAELAGRSSHNFRIALKMLQSGFAPWHLSELAGSLSAVEYGAGRIKRARKLLQQALQDPNDNALAQAEWSAQRGVDVVNPSQLVLPMSFEARAIHALRQRDFVAAANHGRTWLADQPFALDAAKFVTSVAALLAEDYKSAIEAARIGLITNPGNPSLINNLAFAMVNSGDVDGAVNVIATAPLKLTPHEGAILEATRGLICYRIGMREEGNSRYRGAIRLLEHLGERGTAAAAALLWSREEVLFQSTKAQEAFDTADRLVPSSVGFLQAEELSARLSPLISAYRLRLRVSEKTDPRR